MAIAKLLLLYFSLFYLGLILISQLFSNSIIFQPPRTSYKDSAKIIKIKTADGAIISAIYLANDNAKYTILFSHGNAEDLGYVYPYLQALQAHGFAVLAYDYRGYGTSSGRSSERHAYYDSRAVFDYLVNQLHVPTNRIIVYGRSLGAATALDLATQHVLAGLIIDTPFVSAFRVMTVLPILPFDKFNNLKKIKQVQCPVLVIHGMRDRVIPLWHGKKLYQPFSPPA